jgi:predicted HTH domain antitoxin
MDKDEMAAHMRREYAVKLYDKGTLTLTQAANLCGLDMFAFLDVLAKAGVPVADYGEEELEKELAYCE